MDISSVHDPKSEPSRQNGGRKKQQPIAKLHAGRYSALDPELLFRHRNAYVPPWDELRGTLNHLYGENFDANPVPDSIFEATQALVKFFDVRIRLMPSHPIFSCKLVRQLDHMLPAIHHLISRRYRAGLLRSSQIKLVTILYELSLRHWSRMMDLNVDKFWVYWEPFRVGWISVSHFILKVRSERLENLLLKYISEDGCADVVVDGIVRADKKFVEETNRLSDTIRDSKLGYWEKEHLLAERAWNILYWPPS
ncbi:hypothetical protein BJ508DRAFT_381479 [Ascobolus immersus RN42]|uniref:Uncharacterized protein n=1 Tax=Ascobolus immersus RN42 TaxID=1160509 RepID=A0A3N4HEF4_ASCIM|nr:hypothetical protein BJ508DRAFT_381479 [Ascobolus immersus RN42]